LEVHIGDLLPGELLLDIIDCLGAKTGKRAKDSVSVEILLMLIADASDIGRW
jgi:hypothetical protein